MAATNSFKTILFSERNSPFGCEFLRNLAARSDVEVIAVVTRREGVMCPDYEEERPTADFRQLAVGMRIRVVQPSVDCTIFDELSEMAADYFVVANYQLRLSPPMYELPSGLTINFHPSPLPRYAGLRPFFWMARNHETRGGVTAIAVDEIIDGGAIIDHIPIALRGTESEADIRASHFRASVELLHRVVDRFGKLDPAHFTRQDMRERSYYGRVDYVRARGRVDPM